MKKIVVIGAGVGGLSAATVLARRGFDVTVVEAHVYPGGCAPAYRQAGWKGLTNGVKERSRNS